MKIKELNINMRDFAHYLMLNDEFFGLTSDEIKSKLLDNSENEVEQFVFEYADDNRDSVEFYEHEDILNTQDVFNYIRKQWNNEMYIDYIDEDEDEAFIVSNVSTNEFINFIDYSDIHVFKVNLKTISALDIFDFLEENNLIELNVTDVEKMKNKNIDRLMSDLCKYLVNNCLFDIVDLKDENKAFYLRDCKRLGMKYEVIDNIVVVISSSSEDIKNDLYNCLMFPF